MSAPAAIACSRSASSSQPAGHSFFSSATFSLRLVDLPGLDIELAQIFERALVLGIEVERLAVERVGLLVVAGLAQAEAHQIVDIGMLIGRQHRRELGERAFEVLGLDLGAHRGEVRRILRGDIVDRERARSARATRWRASESQL